MKPCNYTSAYVFHVGDTVMAGPRSFDTRQQLEHDRRRSGPPGTREWERIKVQGKIVWVHPKNRFVVVAFDPFGIRESFSPADVVRVR